MMNQMTIDMEIADPHAGIREEDDHREEIQEENVTRDRMVMTHPTAGTDTEIAGRGIAVAQDAGILVTEIWDIEI